MWLLCFIVGIAPQHRQGGVGEGYGESIGAVRNPAEQVRDNNTRPILILKNGNRIEADLAAGTDGTFLLGKFFSALRKAKNLLLQD